MDSQLIVRAVGWYAAFLISVTLHEASHALAALKLGDSTAYRGGQVTINPAPHMRREPLGMCVVPLLSFFLGGWMLGWGTAPYDRNWALENPRKCCWMALAGPAANLFLLVLSGIAIRVGLAWGVFTAPESITFTRVVMAVDNGYLAGAAGLVSIMFSLNLLLFFFNLLPVPPLDGSSLPLMVLGRTDARRYMDIMHNQFAVVGIVVAWYVFSLISRPILVLGLNVLYFGVAAYH
jgi:Zn-dependent protease